MLVVEELHLARSERRLELDIMQSYGELTCMEIDPPEEKSADTHCACNCLVQNFLKLCALFIRPHGVTKS